MQRELLQHRPRRSQSRLLRVAARGHTHVDDEDPAFAGQQKPLASLLFGRGLLLRVEQPFQFVDALGEPRPFA